MPQCVAVEYQVATYGDSEDMDCPPPVDKIIGLFYPVKDHHEKNRHARHQYGIADLSLVGTETVPVSGSIACTFARP